MPRSEYDAKLNYDNESAKIRSRSNRDISLDFPATINPERRAKCATDLRMFFETYFASAFTLAWSDDHLRIIQRMQECIVAGGLMAVAMPRGSGKTSFAIRSALWALMYGYRRFVMIVGATEGDAVDRIAHIKMMLETNLLLAEDFPHICYPIIRLENNARRAGGQLFRERQTKIQWGADRVTLPVMPDAACGGMTNVSGSIVASAGITGAIRGQSHVLPDGTIIRPDQLIIDDCQTRGSAMSITQSAERLAVLNGDCLGLAGPAEQIAGFALVTVIKHGDMSDMLLDRNRSPQWRGERCKAVYSFPRHERLWEQYTRMRQASQKKTGHGEEATEFYWRNRAIMDEGAVIAWPARHSPDEISGVQHCMNKRCDNLHMFLAEYQSEPPAGVQGDGVVLAPDEIAGRVNGLPAGTAPRTAHKVAIFVDVHDSILFYCVTAWDVNFGGNVLAYGAFPQQGKIYYTLRNAGPTLQQTYPTHSKEQAIALGLGALIEKLCGAKWCRKDATPLQAGICLIDAGYLPEIVHQVCGRSRFANILLPSRGVGIGAARKPFSEYQRKPGDKMPGPGCGEWYLPAAAGRTRRELRFDSNFYKSLLMARLGVPLSDKGALGLFGSSPEEHRLLADHCCSEYPIQTSGFGRTLNEWRPRPDGGENHLLDCLCGTAVGASVLGILTPGAAGAGAGPGPGRVMRPAGPPRKPGNQGVTYLNMY